MEENKNFAQINRQKNQTIASIRESNALSFDSELLAKPISESFGVLDNAFSGTPKEYAELELAIQNGKCGECIKEQQRLQVLKEAPAKALEFIEELTGELSVFDTTNVDYNNNADFNILKQMLENQPGFSKKQGFDLKLDLDPMILTATGPGLPKGGKKIAANSLQAILKGGGSIVAETPDIQEEMVDITSKLLQDGGMQQDVKNFSPDAKLAADFWIRKDGKHEYETIMIDEKRGRNVLVPDMDKIKAKAEPFLNASIAYLLDDQESAVALYNTMLRPSVTPDEDMEKPNPVEAGEDSWIYQEVLPLSPENKKIFSEQYKKYWEKNYLNPFVKNQLPLNPKDQEIFVVKTEEEESKPRKRDPRVDNLLKKYGVIK